MRFELKSAVVSLLIGLVSAPGIGFCEEAPVGEWPQWPIGDHVDEQPEWPIGTHVDVTVFIHDRSLGAADLKVEQVVEDLLIIGLKIKGNVPDRSPAYGGGLLKADASAGTVEIADPRDATGNLVYVLRTTTAGVGKVISAASRGTLLLKKHKQI